MTRYLAAMPLVGMQAPVFFFAHAAILVGSLCVELNGNAYLVLDATLSQATARYRKPSPTMQGHLAALPNDMRLALLQ